MLHFKILRLFNRVLFFFKFLLLKVFLGSKIQFPEFYRSCIDSGSIISCVNGILIFKGRFISRRFLTINISSGKVIIGKNVFTNQNVSINCHNFISIGDNTIIGESVKFYDHNHRFNKDGCIKDQGFTSKPIIIGNNVWIGSSSVILNGVEIGNNSVISAGSVIRSSIPENSIYKDGRVVNIMKKED